VPPRKVSSKATQKAATTPKAVKPATPRTVQTIDLKAAEQIRVNAGLGKGEGPSAQNVQAAVNVYIERFDFWYHRQWETIRKNYVTRLVRRVNPFVRRGQHGDCSAEVLALALVADWDSRNFVTAGGQALEAVAIAAGPHSQKAIAEGVDIQRSEPGNPGAMHLYVVKSGAVTRNTDIVASMKTNLRKAEKLALQNTATKSVRLNYATCVGTPSTTLADGVHRPSSAKFWSEILELDEVHAIKVIWAIIEEGAKRIVIPDLNRKALVAQVSTYVEKDDGSGLVDWEFMIKVVTLPMEKYKVEHKKRDLAATKRGHEVLAKG